MELVDIKLEQTNEWLMLRKKIDKNWARYLKPVEGKHSAALVKLQENKELKELIPTDVCGYLQAKELFNRLLSSSEVDKGKTVFGNFTSEAIYEWENLVKNYEKNNLYLADCGKHLLQIGVYEVPSLKSTLQSFEKQIKEFQQKEQSITEEIGKKHKSFKEKCAKYAVEGTNLHYELQCTTRKIPDIYLEILVSLKSPDFLQLLHRYESVTMQNHSSKVDLPTIENLQEFNCDFDLEKIKNKYCRLVNDDSGVIEIPDDLSEWVIEMVDEGKIIEIDDDFPLSNRQTRTDLVTELIEIEAFADVLGEQQSVVKNILKTYNTLHELILIHEQPEYLERLLQQFYKLNDRTLQNKLTECQKFQESLKENTRSVHEKICEQLAIANKMIIALESGINKLFPNISVKIVGELNKDIKHYLA